ncbi:MAG TPA: hypothetical protein VMI33_00735 [Streptosporangiaceae bacterium]|nr:hypothetical protein [Streptosporangiaceae bacterium]
MRIDCLLGVPVDSSGTFGERPGPGRMPRPGPAADHGAGFRGMDVTILNPTRDPDGSSARRVVHWLADVLA